MEVCPYYTSTMSVTYTSLSSKKKFATLIFVSIRFHEYMYYSVTTITAAT